MAKLTPLVLGYQKENFDSGFSVSIRIGHKSKNAYIDAEIKADKKDLLKGKLKQAFVVGKLSDRLNAYEAILKENFSRLDELTAQDIKALLLAKREAAVSEVDFMAFFADHIEQLKARGVYWRTFHTAYMALKSVTTADRPLLATDITSFFLTKFEKYLLEDKEKAKNDKGKNVGAHNIMREIRTVFNRCLLQYNDEDSGKILIPNNPYKKYKLPKLKSPEPRGLSILQVVAVKRLIVPKDTRAELARDLAVLSFYLCGMNAKDLFNIVDLVSGRVNYNRSKTKGKRADSAFISVLLPVEARPLWDKYIASKMIQKRYASSQELNHAISKGMLVLRELSKIPFLQFYSFRHSFATIARNHCRFSKDDIALAMNHVDNINKVTDIYIQKDWAIIDDVQKGVINALEIEDLL
jgi:integrase